MKVERIGVKVELSAWNVERKVEKEEQLGSKENSSGILESSGLKVEQFGQKVELGTLNVERKLGKVEKVALLKSPT
ncbi:MAG: hypothetical protein ABS884_05585 [Solibacillus isronensis]